LTLAHHPDCRATGTGDRGNRLYGLLKIFGGLATPAVRTLIEEARAPTGGAPGTRHPTLLAIVTRFAHEGWPDQSLRDLILPQVHATWGDGDWSAHLDRMLAWVRAREVTTNANEGTA
jgi:hypothetical protein